MKHHSNKHPSADPVATGLMHVATLLDECVQTLDGLSLSAPRPRKRGVAKMRKGGERVVDSIALLVQSNKLDSPSLQSETMLEKLGFASKLAAIGGQLTKLQLRIGAEQDAASSEAWGMALEFYALLQRRAIRDSELAASLEPVTSFFAYRHSKVLEARPTKLETRAQAKLREAERLVSRVRPRAGEAPVDSPPEPVVNKPVASAVAPAAPRVNGVANGGNGAANGTTGAATEGSGMANGTGSAG